MILVLLMPCLSAQAQGYLGRRWIVGVEGSGSFNLNQVVGRTNTLRTQFYLEGSLEYVLTRRLSLQLGAGGFDLQTFYQYQGASGLVRLQGQIVEPSLKLYSLLRRGNLAPIGPYQRFSVMGVRNVLTDLDYNLFPDQRRALGIQYDLALAYAWGTQWIFYDRLALDVSLQAGWPLNLNRNRAPTTTSNFLTDLVTARLRRYLLLNAQVRVAWLIR